MLFRSLPLPPFQSFGIFLILRSQGAWFSMAAGYFVRGTCVANSSAGLTVCHQNYPVIAWTDITFSTRSCIGSTSSGPDYTLTEKSCVGTTCQNATSVVSLSPCDTSDTYVAMLTIFGAFLAVQSLIWGYRKLISLFTHSHLATE